MYTKQEASAIRQQFWTTLGQYLSPIPSAAGDKINWINYKTGIKNIHFKMDADKDEAIIRIEIRGEEVKRELIYNLFLSLQKQFNSLLINEFTWQKETFDEHNKPLGCIYSVSGNLNVFKKEDWPDLISFFKNNITALDAFWAAHKEIF
ncbi:MAG: DUF4268 domain-containing protein [Ferruginibacter sp.]